MDQHTENYLSQLYSVACRLAPLAGAQVTADQLFGGSAEDALQLLREQFGADVVFRAGQLLRPHDPFPVDLPDGAHSQCHGVGKAANRERKEASVV